MAPAARPRPRLSRADHPPGLTAEAAALAAEDWAWGRGTILPELAELAQLPALAAFVSCRPGPPQIVLRPRPFSCVCQRGEGALTTATFSCQQCGIRGHSECYMRDIGDPRLCHGCRATESQPEFWQFRCGCDVSFASDGISCAPDVQRALDLPMFECECCRRWGHIACYGGAASACGHCEP